ncbi:MAG: hypothetical protein AAFV53_37225 [Myxococcota bacterium]
MMTASQIADLFDNDGQNFDNNGLNINEVAAAHAITTYTPPDLGHDSTIYQIQDSYSYIVINDQFWDELTEGDYRGVRVLRDSGDNVYAAWIEDRLRVMTEDALDEHIAQALHEAQTA